jgi:hypothetical protein
MWYIYRPYNRNTARMECKNKNDTSHNRGEWNHLSIIQTVPEEHTGKAGNQGTTANSHIGQCTHTSESTVVMAQNIEHGKQ